MLLTLETVLTLAWWKVIVAAAFGALTPCCVCVVCYMGLRRHAADLRFELANQRSDLERILGVYERLTREQRADAVRVLSTLSDRIESLARRTEA